MRASRARLWSLGPCLALLACTEAFTSEVDTVARAGRWRLTVDRLGEIFAQSKALVARPDVVERVAQLWVDYALYAQRAVAGDSILDSASVLAVVWREVQQRRADHFHEVLIRERVKLDSAQVDSIYHAGNLRLIRHVLFRTEQTMAPPARAAKQREARAVRARLRSGGSWAEANRKNQDARAQPSGGSVGVVARGDLMPAVEAAAFELPAGGLSDVVESPLGYHLLSRPALRDARDEFRLGLEDRMVAELDSAYLGTLPGRRHFQVRRGAAARARAAIADPRRFARSRSVLGTFDGGRFTVADLIRWVQAMPPQLRTQIDHAADDQWGTLIRQLMRNQAMMIEADSAGVVLTPADLAEFRDMLRRDLAALSEGLGIDSRSLPDSAALPDERGRMAEVKVDQYLEAVAANRATFVAVPTFLATRLREGADWKVVSAAIDRVLARAQALKAAIDSARAAQPEPPPAPPADSGGTNATP